MGRWWVTWIFVFLIAASIPMILALCPLAWTLRAARAGLRSIKPRYGVDDGPGLYVETYLP